MIIFKQPDNTYHVSAMVGETRVRPLFCDLDITEAFLLIRYSNGAVLTGQEKIDADNLIINNECPPDAVNFE